MISLEIIALSALAPMQFAGEKDSYWGKNYNKIGESDGLELFMSHRVGNNLTILYDSAIKVLPFALRGTWTDSTVHITNFSMPYTYFSNWDGAKYDTNDLPDDYIGMVYNVMVIYDKHNVVFSKERISKFMHDKDAVIELLITHARHDSIPEKSFWKGRYMMKTIPKDYNSELHRKNNIKNISTIDRLEDL